MRPGNCVSGCFGLGTVEQQNVVLCYDADATVTFKVTESNFYAEDIVLTVLKDGTVYAPARSGWTQKDDEWTDIMTLSEEGEYTFTLAYTDRSNNQMVEYTSETVVVDKTNPVIEVVYDNNDAANTNYYKADRTATITITEHNFRADDVNVTVNAVDVQGNAVEVTDYAGYLATRSSWSYLGDDRYQAEITYSTDANYSFSIDYRDLAARAATQKTSEFTVDHIAPQNVSVAYSESILQKILSGVTFGYYNPSVTVTLTATDETSGVDYFEWTYTQESGTSDVNKAVDSGKIDSNITCTYADGVQTAVASFTLTASEAEQYRGSISFTATDKAANTRNELVDQENVVVVDTISPTRTVTYSAAKQVVDSDCNTVTGYDPETENQDVILYYDDDAVVTFKVDEANFYAEDLDIEVVRDGAVYEDAELSDWSQKGDVWTRTITLSEEGEYTFKAYYGTVEDDITQGKSVSGADRSGNAMEVYESETIVVDRTAPVIASAVYADGEIKNVANGRTYYQSVQTATIIITEHNFRADDVNVTVTAVDAQGNAVEVEDFAAYLRNRDSWIYLGNDQYQAEITYSADANYTFDIDYTDLALLAANDYKQDSFVVDTVAPERTVTASEAKQVVDAATLLTKTDYDYSAENTNAILYYDGDATLTFEVAEANFYPADINAGTAAPYGGTIMVSKDGGTAYAVTPTDWNLTDGVWTGTITLSGDGSYVVTMDYTDRSQNEMAAYQSQEIVVDTTDPFINVSYSNTDVKNVVDGRTYYDDVQAATITVTERNFRADDIAAAVTAVNVVGDNVSVADFAGYLADRSSWTDDGDTHTAVITYSADANYTFDIDYKDLATRASSDYVTDLFTVDKTSPTNLTVSYSASVLDRVLESVTFGFYNAQLTVTITADDETSSIYHFLYSYVNSQGVSGVNAELIDEAIQNASISHSGRTGTATFTIPKLALGSDNQFNGTVNFTAYDCSENSTDMADTKRIVVDNISPTANISLNDPVKTENEIAYYDGDVTATIEINEANFYPEDVVISVTKDGNTYPVSASWSNNSVDVHTGSFTLTEEGDYFITIDYTDRSANKMATYTSSQLTIDTTDPVITVSDLAANSANKDDVFSFSITADDTNLDMDTFQPSLTTVVKDENGKYSTVQIDLGTPAVIESGKTVTYTIENLAQDGIYTLVCSVEDMAGHVYNLMTLDDNEDYEQVQFSINRNGSTFGFPAEDTYTQTLVNMYYVYAVYSDIVVEEVNTDPIEDYTVTVNGEELTNGLTTTQTSNDGEWSKRTYTIDKSVFDAEGEYIVEVSSVDKTGTQAFSDVKNLEIAFVVDQTAPVVSVSGLESNGRYRTEEQTVTLAPTDDGGRLNSLKVIATVEGTESVRFDMEGEEFLTYLSENNGQVTFAIPSGYQNTVQIICNDCAVDNQGKTNEYNEIFEKVTVSTSGWVIFYANKPVFYGCIAAVVVVAGGIIVLIAAKRRKKETADTTAK